jgi:hypothetical protein
MKRESRSCLRLAPRTKIEGFSPAIPLHQRRGCNDAKTLCTYAYSTTDQHGFAISSCQGVHLALGATPFVAPSHRPRGRSKCIKGHCLLVLKPSPRRGLERLPQRTNAPVPRGIVANRWVLSSFCVPIESGRGCSNSIPAGHTVFQWGAIGAEQLIAIVSTPQNT